MALQTVESAARPWEGIKRRIASSIVLAALVISAEIIGGLYFTALTMLAAMQMILEFNRMTGSWGIRWRIVGMFYVMIPCLSFIWLRNLDFPSSENGGMIVVLFLMAIVVATDIGAFFSGRIIGGPKLIPSISPKKTWAGLLGGMVLAAVVAYLSLPHLPVTIPIPALVSLAVCLAVVAQAGDFFESWIKRKAGVKDSGTLIPGHGGLLDRLDGFMFATPFLLILLLLFGIV